MRQSSRLAAVAVAVAAATMSRKDDPVLNVRFVQLVECHPCLWNSNLPAYSKKEEIQKAWQEVANETKDTVRNCRERWRTIRSSFLRSLKLSRTTTGRGKRKYYLSKYLQFLIPYTKTRLKNGANIIALRKVCLQPPPPMTHIKNMPMPIVSSASGVGIVGIGSGGAGSDDTKDSIATALGIAEEDVVVSLHEGTSSVAAHMQHQHQQQQHSLQAPPRLPTPIKTELGATEPQTLSGAGATTATNAGGGSSSFLEPQPAQRSSAASSSAVDLTEFAEWIKSKNDHQRHCLMPHPPDADQSFLNSLHPFLKEMSGKQNRRFRQKVVALIDAILDNAD